MKIQLIFLLFAFLKQQASVEGKKGQSVTYAKHYADTDKQRAFIPLRKQKWKTEYGEYDPTEWTELCSLETECDPLVIAPKELNFNTMDKGIDRKSLEGKYSLNKYGEPMNPKGRTGISGRGSLPRWGPNFYAVLLALRGPDPYEILVKNTGEYSVLDVVKLPGEFIVNHTEKAIPPKMRDLFRQNLEAQSYSREQVEDILLRADQKVRKIYGGFIADERNTDNSWVEMILYGIEDRSHDGIGLVKPSLTPGLEEMTWDTLNSQKLMTQMERVAQRSHMSTTRGIKLLVTKWKEQHRLQTAEQNGEEAFGILCQLIDDASLGMGLSLFG